MTTPESATVLDRITNAVAGTCLDLDEFAHASRVAPERLAGILSGSRPPSSLDLARIAETATTTVGWLLDGTPAPTIRICITR